MSNLIEARKAINPVEQASLTAGRPSLLKRIRGGFLLGLGYLLSPLSWWNDLFFNLPFAYGLGYLASLASPQFFLPAAIGGYWLSNVLGILMMQFGWMDTFQGEAKERDLKKELRNGILSSTAYTLLILGLIHFHVLETPNLDLEEGAFNLTALLPFGGNR